MPGTPKIIVIGGGIAGSAVAFFALRAGARVLVIDEGSTSTSATWASGGMLAPAAEMLTGGLLELGLTCLGDYPRFLTDIKAAGARPVALRRGVLVPTAPTAGRAAMDSYLRVLARTGLSVMFTDAPKNFVGNELRNIAAAAWVPDDAWIDPRELLAALQLAVNHLGGELRVGRTVRIAANIVELADGTSEAADLVVIAAGHTAANLDGITWKQFGKITGDRGIMLHVTGGPIPAGVIFDHGLDGVCYIVPQADGVRIGSTTDTGNPSAAWNENEVRLLLERAQRLWPVDRNHVRSVAVGFRPVGPLTTSDPFVGPLSDDGRIWGLLGMHRNGILFGPELARNLVRRMLQAAV